MDVYSVSHLSFWPLLHYDPDFMLEFSVRLQVNVIIGQQSGLECMKFRDTTSPRARFKLQFFKHICSQSQVFKMARCSY